MSYSENQDRDSAARAEWLKALILDTLRHEDEERDRLARILHDDTQQLLAAAGFRLDLMRPRAASDEELVTHLDKIARILDDCQEKARRVSHELRPSVLNWGSMADVLHWLAARVTAEHGLEVRVLAEEQDEKLPDVVRAVLYFGARELLLNVARHAGVKSAVAEFCCTNCGRVTLAVGDEGMGFDPVDIERDVPGPDRLSGLLRIRERIRLLGGEMELRSAPGRGTRIFIDLPLSEELHSR